MSRTRKLTADQVRRLREWHASRRTPKQMAAELGISTSTLRAYLRGDHKTHMRTSK